MFSDLLVYLQGQLYQFPFFFKSNSPYDGFIYLEMVGNHSCRPQISSVASCVQLFVTP